MVKVRDLLRDCLKSSEVEGERVEVKGRRKGIRGSRIAMSYLMSYDGIKGMVNNYIIIA